MRLLIFLSLCLAFAVGCQLRTQPSADLVLRGGKVVTLNPDRPLAEALAITGERITAVGSNTEIDAFMRLDETRNGQSSLELDDPGLRPYVGADVRRAAYGRYSLSRDGNGFSDRPLGVECNHLASPEDEVGLGLGSELATYSKCETERQNNKESHHGSILREKLL